MSDPSDEPWSNRPNAPPIAVWLYLAEKQFFAGTLIGAITYGIVVALFFQCVGVLLSPANPMGRGTKWTLVAHTVALFSFLTMAFGIGLNELSIIYINYREFPVNNEVVSGPLGYKRHLITDAASLLLDAMFPLNQWLADGLLLHRCYIIYSMNRWAMAFPCLMYLASVVLGIAYIYLLSVPIYRASVIATNIATSYYSICLTLNIILTLMIVIRLVVHVKDIRKTIGASDGSGARLHTVASTVATMIVESYALYAITLLSWVVSWALESWVVTLFSGAVGSVQVIAPYLIILRVAKRRALTSQSVSGTVGSIYFKSQGSTDCDGSLSDKDPANTMEVNGEAAGELFAGDENVVGGVPL